jgi:ubiquinone/menaquinone biosynthesis C-methylase UbiE
VIVHKARRFVLTRLFRFLYWSGQWVYDPLTALFFGPAWHNWRRTVLPWVGPGPTLEIGCGTGNLLPEISARSRFVVGMDRSSSMLSAAVRNGIPKNSELCLADATILPFLDGVFDSVVSTFPANFIAAPKTLDEIARVIRPGGAFVVVVSARFTRFQWKRPFIHPVLRIAYGSASSMNRWPETLMHHELLPGEWQDLRTPEGEAFVWLAHRVER